MLLQNLVIAALLGVSASPAGPAVAPRGTLIHTAEASPPGIRLWTSHGEVYRRGERVRVYFRTELDAYVTIFRVDTDGRVRVLFPREPWEQNYVRGGYTYDVPNYTQHDAFVVDDDPGVGYVFGVASVDPFQYDAFANSNHWDLALVSDYGRIHGDPYESLEDLVQRMIPPGYADYDTHLLPYDVERHYDYPRFVCYDCHSYVGYAYWDPYSYWCPRYTLFVYRDPFYFYPSYWYPTRYYGGTRVVYVRPAERGGMYVFKARGDQSAPSIAYRDRRTDDATARRPADRGVRGVDIGGVGSIPVPGGRRAIGEQGGAGPGAVQGGRRMIGDQGAAARGEQGARTPQPRIQLIPGNGQVPGRRGEPVPAITPGAGEAKGNVDAGGRRAVTPTETPRYLQPLNDQPRGVYIDPKTQSDPRAVPSEGGRRSEPVYLGRQPQPVRAPEARQPEPRNEPRAAPQTDRRPETRPTPAPRAPEPRAAPPPRSPEPRAAPAPRASEPRSAPPAPRQSPPPSRGGEGRRRPG
jgi:hypothetical protein